MFSNTVEQTYLIDQNKSLSENIKKTEEKLREKEEEYKDLEADNDKLDASVRYQRGLLSNFHAVNQEKTQALKKYEQLSKLINPAFVAPHRLITTYYGYLAMMLLSYGIATLAGAPAFLTAATWELTCWASAMYALDNLSQKYATYEKHRKNLIQDIRNKISQAEKTEKSIDHVQELIDNV